MRAATPRSAPASTRATSPARALVVVALVALAARVLFARLYGPVVEGDSLTYLRIGRLLALGRLDAYDGAAPPVYGAFLELLGEAPARVFLFQSLLGAASSVLVAWLVWRPTRSTPLAIAAGLAHALALDTLCFEAYLVTESLATVLTLGGAALLTLALERPRPSPWLALAVALTLALAGLVKPFLLFLLPVALVAMAWRWSATLRSGAALAAALAFALPVLVLVGGWCAHNQRTQGVFGPSTMTGYRLSQHVGSVMQDAPDRYRVLRGLFVAHRAVVVARTGSAINTIWEAIPDMQRATGLSYGRLSLEVNAMSVAVARRHPEVFARSVATAWLWFWSRPMYLKPAYAHGPQALRLLGWLARVERPFALGLNLAFLAFALVTLLRPRAARLCAAAPARLFGLVILLGSGLQALAEHSDNGRFAVPFLPLMVVAVALAIATAARPAPDRAAAPS